MNPASLVLAAASSDALSTLKHVPKETWINVAIYIVAAFFIFKTWAIFQRVNSYAPYIALCVVFAIIFFYWVYNRTEPAFLSPFVSRLAEFLPTKPR